MNTGEIFTRLQLGTAMIAGFMLGQYAATLTTPHNSGYFTIGFATGFVVTRGLFRLGKHLFVRHRPLPLPVSATAKTGR